MFGTLRQVPSFSLPENHPDFAVLAELAASISARIRDRPDQAFVEKMVEAVEFVLDPVKTGRTAVSELDNVEKTFVGLKIEHYVRDLLDAPKGIRDLSIGGRDLDIKNTVSHNWSWMIPPETYRDEEPVLLIAVDDRERRAWMGLFVARSTYLGSPNRDGKRGILKAAYDNILWLAEGLPWPKSRWEGLDMSRFRELRRKRGGAVRAATFFSENLGRRVHRSIVQALLHDQCDYMKRLRGNGGARDLLSPQGIALLSGSFDRTLAHTLDYALAREEHIAIAPRNEKQRQLLIRLGKIQP